MFPWLIKDIISLHVQQEKNFNCVITFSLYTEFHSWDELGCVMRKEYFLKDNCFICSKSWNLCNEWIRSCRKRMVSCLRLLKPIQEIGFQMNICQKISVWIWASHSPNLHSGVCWLCLLSTDSHQYNWDHTVWFAGVSSTHNSDCKFYYISLWITGS